MELIFRAIYLLAVATLTAKFMYWFGNYLYKWYFVSKIPGLPITLPVFGNIHYFTNRLKLLDSLKYHSNRLKEHQIFRIWIGFHPWIMFHKCESLDVLMSSSKNTEKSFEYTFLHPWLGRGLLTSYGDKWQKRRRMITPAFHFDILDDFLLVMNEQADILVDNLLKISKTQKEVDIFKHLTLCTLDIICETAMGQNVNAQKDENSEFVKATARMSELIMHRIFRPYLWPDFIYSYTSYGREHKHNLDLLHMFTKRVIMERDADFDDRSNSSERTSKRRQAFLDILLKAKREDPTVTFDDIQEEVDTFMFEGHDTTAAASGWACHLIGSHPHVQRKIHEEIDRVLGSSSRQLTKEDLKELNYLECVLKESLRLFPSVPFFGRIISEDTKVGQYRLFQGDTAMVLAFMVHRDEKHWPNPEKFDPDRFLPENSKDRHPYAYIPFSAGRRNCIGQKFAQMEEKVLLANILRQFEIRSLNTTEELNPVGELIQRPLNGITIDLKLRN